LVSRETGHEAAIPLFLEEFVNIFLVITRQANKAEREAQGRTSLLCTFLLAARRVFDRNEPKHERASAQNEGSEVRTQFVWFSP